MNEVAAVSNPDQVLLSHLDAAWLPEGGRADVVLAGGRVAAPSRPDGEERQEFTPPQFAPVSLRWILTHMIDETARHLGHVDLMRERLDGTRSLDPLRVTDADRAGGARTVVMVMLATSGVAGVARPALDGLPKSSTSCPHHPGLGQPTGTPDLGATKEIIISTHQHYNPGHLASREELATRPVSTTDQALPVVQHQTAGLHWPQYVNTHRLVGGLVAGFAALHIADMIGYWMPGIGLPKLDFAYFNGAILMPDAAASTQWFEGQFFHTFNGIVFALGYALLVFPLMGKTLTTPRNVGRGVIMGMVLATLSCLWWIPTQNPDLHAGFMSLNLGVDLVFGVYLWHLAWSLALGFFFNPQD